MISDPFLLPEMQVDKGAIRFILSGANIMCPGLTSPGARMTKVPEGTVVVSLSSNMCSLVCIVISCGITDNIPRDLEFCYHPKS